LYGKKKNPMTTAHPSRRVRSIMKKKTKTKKTKTKKTKKSKKEPKNKKPKGKTLMTIKKT
jgi:hypothetical protein